MAYCVNGSYSINGGLGIRTDAPAYGLDVRGTGIGDAAISLNNTTAAGRVWNIYSTGDSFSQGCGGLLFYRNWADGGSGTMYLDCLGRVGIGTTTPATHNGIGLVVSGTGIDKRGIIEVWDSGISNAKSVFQNVGGDTYIGQLGRGTGNGDVYLLTGGNGSSATISMTIKCNGNVGIGTEALASNIKLQICDGNANGTDDMVRLMQCLPGNHAFYRSQRCGGATLIMGPTRNSGDGCIPSESAIIWTTTNNPIVIGTCGRQRMRFATDGNAVLGGASANIVGFNGTVLTVNGGGNYQGYEVATSNVSRMTMVSDGNNGYLSTRVAGMCLIFEAGAASEKMRITSDGNVGIGTSSPSTVLDIRGCNIDNAVTVRNFCGDSYSAIGYVNCQGTLKAAVGIGNNSAAAPFANNAYVYTPASTDFLFYIAGGERMRVRCDGNVGIGITTPCAPLSFGTVIGNKIDFYYTTAGSGDRYGIQVQESELRITSGAAGACAGGITFGKQSTSTFTEAMRVTNAGCVGIGTCSPSYRLHVNGTFYAAGSSIKYKEGICNYDTDSCLFMCLKPVTYQYKYEWQHLGRELKSQSQIGLIAEDVAQVMPELAILVNEEDEKVVRNVDYEKLSVVLLKEVQKLRQEVDELKNNK